MADDVFRVRQVAIELLVAAIFGIGETIDRLVTHADRMALQPHAARNLFCRPASLQSAFNSSLHLGVSDQLTMDRAALLIFVLSDERVIPV